jgi:hypothetical protein
MKCMQSITCTCSVLKCKQEDNNVLGYHNYVFAKALSSMFQLLLIQYS